ncbi:MAG: cation transporter [Proteobacteria bacterium]|nr:MAG: cation transporter [Pseudomonadota bacterium]
MGGHHHHHGHHHHDHNHSHDHADHSAEAQASVLSRIRFAFYLNFTFAIIELVGGAITGSFAIIADAIHDLGDSASLALALYMQKKSQGGPSESMPYGYLRYSVVSAIITGIVIISGSFVVLIEAIQRLLSPEAMPNAVGMMGLAVVGIVVNGISAFRLAHGHSHNEKILSWHLIEDLLAWIVVLIGAICIYFFKVAWIDPVLAVLIAIFVSYNVVKNLREPFRIILQYVPGAEDMSDLKKQLSAFAGIASIVELQAWTLDGYQHVLSTRITVSPDASRDVVREELRGYLKQRGYKFVTIEVD